MKHTARDYQEQDVQAILDAFEQHRSALYVAATGLGKTFVMTEVQERMGVRALLLAHRSELVWQAREAFLRRGIDVEIEKGELAASTSVLSNTPVIIATVQTLGSGKEELKRMKRFRPTDFGLLLYDEAHGSVSVGNKKIVEYFVNGNPRLRVLGVTATPDRLDEKALGQIFETVAASRDIMFGVSHGWLVRPKQLLVHVGGLDFSKIRTTAGDLNGADLEAAMTAEEPSQRVAQATLEAMFRCTKGELSDTPVNQWPELLMAKPKPKRTIAFTVSVKQAEILASIMNRVVPGVATWVAGSTPPQQREDIFRQFGAGEISCLVNCNVTTEGYDNPAVELIVMAAPTKSRSRHAQRVGRGTRPLPGVVDGCRNAFERIGAIARSDKPELVVLDFAGNAGRHKLVTTADLLAGHATEEAIKSANEKAKELTEPVNMKQLVEEEEERLKREREMKRQAEEARKAKLVARYKYSVTEVDAFDAFDMHPTKLNGEHKEISPELKAKLMQQGINPDKLTYHQAQQLRKEMFRRWRGKYATLKQCSTLKKFYPALETRTLKLEQASAMLDKLRNNGWRLQ